MERVKALVTRMIGLRLFAPPTARTAVGLFMDAACWAQVSHNFTQSRRKPAQGTWE